MKYSINDFVSFYFKFKELVEVQKYLKFGKNPHIPSKFSENLVKYLLGYDDWEGKDFDAQTKDNLGVEIKATGSANGATSIKLEQLSNTNFSHIEWLYINFETDQVTVKKIEKKSLSKFIKDNKGKQRPNIRLNQYDYSSSISYQFKKNHKLEKINVVVSN